MKEDATAREKEAKPPRKHASRRALLRDAFTIIKELGAGLGMAEICAKHGWTKPAYYRRLRLAEELTHKEYDPRHVYAAFMRHEAIMRGLESEVREQAAQIARLISAAGGDDPGLQVRLQNALTAKMKFICACEKQIMKAAIDLEILPPGPEDAPNRGMTFAEWRVFEEKVFAQYKEPYDPDAPDVYGCRPDETMKMEVDENGRSLWTLIKRPGYKYKDGTTVPMWPEIKCGPTTTTDGTIVPDSDVPRRSLSKNGAVAPAGDSGKCSAAAPGCDLASKGGAAAPGCDSDKCSAGALARDSKLNAPGCPSCAPGAVKKDAPPDSPRTAPSKRGGHMEPLVNTIIEMKISPPAVTLDDVERRWAEKGLFQNRETGSGKPITFDDVERQKAEKAKKAKKG